MDSIQLGQHRN